MVCITWFCHGVLLFSYHAVHGKVIVLGLKIHGMRVIVTNLSVAGQKQTFIVHDPVEHLQTHTHYFLEGDGFISHVRVSL